VPIGEGWWLRIRDGRAFPVEEHLAAVLVTPSRFGLARGDSIGTREEILRRVLKNGWIRVRYADSYTVFEFDAPREDAMMVIQRFAEDAGTPGTYGTARINALRTRTSVEVTGADLLVVSDPVELLGVTLVAGRKRRSNLVERKRGGLTFGPDGDIMR